MERPHFFIPNTKTSVESVGKGNGGPNYKRPNYTVHGRRIYQQMSRFDSSIREKKDFEYSDKVYTKIQSPNNINLSGIKTPLEHLGIYLTSIDSSDESKGIFAIKKSDLKGLTEKIRNYYRNPKNPNKSYIKYIEQIIPLTAEDKLHFTTENLPSTKMDIILNLFDEVSEEKVDVLIGILKSDYRMETASLKKVVLDEGFCSISISAETEKIIEISNSFNLVQSVDVNPRAIITQSIPSIEIDPTLDILYDKDNPSVVVVDSGVIASGLLQNCVKSSSQTLPFGTTVPEYSHGTFVASRISFGDDLDRNITSGQIQSHCNIIDVAVFGSTQLPDGTQTAIGPDRMELIDILKAVATTLRGDARVINLSLSEENPILDNSYSPTAYTIDYLSRKFDILFVIASGNINSELGAFPSDHFISPNARICPPAESILGITVGAYSKYSDVNALSRENQVSPFSRRGPGIKLALKPDLVHHGGNLLSGYSTFARIATSGLSQSGKHLATDNGTSFSAPIVSQIAARLFKYYNGRTSNLIKALLIHYADDVDHHPVLGIEKEHQVGFGIPNFEKAINADNNSASFLYEGVVKNDEFKILKFHVPSMMASENPNSKLKIKVTVVTNPPVDFRDPARYAQSKVSIGLDKLDSTYIKKSVSFSTEDKTGSSWSPIQQIEKSFSRSYACGEWELRIRCWTRGEKLASDFEQDFAVVIEIIDELGNGDPYNGILNETGNTYLTRIIRIDRAA